MPAKTKTLPTTVIEDGRVLDYITDRPIKDSPKEQVRQHLARALFHEYGISVDDMAPGFKIPVDGHVVFMAVAKKVGFDRRDAPLFKGSPDGEEILEDQEETERVRYSGESVMRTLKRKRRIPDNDLPAIAAAYRVSGTSIRSRGPDGRTRPLPGTVFAALRSFRPA